MIATETTKGLLHMNRYILSRIYYYSIDSAGHDNALALTCKSIAAALLPTRDDNIRRGFRGSHNNNSKSTHINCIINHIKAIEVEYTCSLRNIYVPFSVTANVSKIITKDKDSYLSRVLTIELQTHRLILACRGRKLIVHEDNKDQGIQIMDFIQKFVPQLHSILGPVMANEGHRED